MPRTFATFDLDYYDDKAVIGLSPDAERVYMRLVISPTLTQAGTGPWQPRQLHRQLPDFDGDDTRLAAAMAELEAARFAYLDTDTEEILIRPFMRRDGVAKQPNVLKNAIGVALLVRSLRLREILGGELARIARERAEMGPPAGRGAGAWASTLEQLDRTVNVLVPHGFNPSAGTLPAEPLSGDPSAGTLNGEPFPPNPSSDANPQATDPHHPHLRVNPEPFRRNPSPVTLPPEPHGVGEGVGEIITTEGGTGGGVAHAHTRTREDHPTTPPPGNLDPDNPRCEHHTHIPATDRGPNCLACRRVRQWCEQAPDRAAAARAQAAATARATTNACTACDEAGWLLADDGTPVEPVIRCDHLSVPRAMHA